MAARRAVAENSVTSKPGARFGQAPSGRGDEGDFGRRRGVRGGTVVDRDLPAHSRGIGRPVAEGIFARASGIVGLRVVGKSSRYGQNERQDGKSNTWDHRDVTSVAAIPRRSHHFGNPGRFVRNVCNIQAFRCESHCY